MNKITTQKTPTQLSNMLETLEECDDNLNIGIQTQFGVMLISIEQAKTVLNQRKSDFRIQMKDVLKDGQKIPALVLIEPITGNRLEFRQDEWTETLLLINLYGKVIGEWTITPHILDLYVKKPLSYWYSTQNIRDEDPNEYGEERTFWEMAYYKSMMHLSQNEINESAIV